MRALLSTAHPAVMKDPPPPSPKFPPFSITAVLDANTDPTGTGDVFRGNIQVDGYAPAYSTVWLAVGTRPGYFTNVTEADTKAHYSFTIPAGYGTTILRVFAEAPGSDYSKVVTVDVTRGDEIEAWDAYALEVLQDLDAPADESARILAIMHAAQYDAVAAITSPNSAYQVHLAAPQGASAEAAADSAAYAVLTGIFPGLTPSFQPIYEAAVGGLPVDAATRAGETFGAQVAAQTLANRANDGSSTVFLLTPSNVDGRWRPTPPTYSAAVDSQYGLVTPFEIAGGSEFRPAAPPAVGSATYDLALSQVATIGGTTSSTRTPAQTAAAEFWGNSLVSGNTPGPWNKIAEELSLARKDTLVQDARLFAQLDFALADAAIAGADSQVTYDEWRPVSAIQQTNPSFTPLVATPASPGYVSNRAAFGSAAAAVLANTFGSKTKFTADIPDDTGATALTRTFPSFAAAAEEDSNSQVWGGVNFSFDAQAGLTLGTQVAQTVLAKFPKGK